MNKVTVNIHMEVFSMHLFLTHLVKLQGVWLLDSLIKSIIHFVKQLTNCPKWQHHFAFPPAVAVNATLCCSISAPAVIVLDFRHSNRCVEVSHCCNLLFSNNVWCCASSHILIYHLFIFFSEMSVQIFLFFKLSCMFLLSFPGGSDSKESACNVEDLGLIPG